ncbi:MAG: hypothetical protein AVDCRST_MAG26-2073 [uncultured Chloroflexia bacterium]|uniref:Uncharacterized protein n=1 Tax=uncultured Chloroflexia bacterium TaxID=1672391 RepID=A0A6J4INX4_9CHLR|nr:MAG: hypothetical protein AVDCRST_MAG26-2073 [uncultured Chloroflexia bacterium]
MPITGQTPQPGKQEPRRSPNLSWIIFLLILARPIWTMVRSIIPPQVANNDIFAVVVGVLVLGVFFFTVARLGRGRNADTRLPTGPRQVRSSTTPRASVPRPVLPAGGPRFEPIITGKVMFAGVVLLAIFAAVFLLLVTG